jgi:hypothetical protein
MRRRTEREGFSAQSDHSLDVIRFALLFETGLQSVCEIIEGFGTLWMRGHSPGDNFSKRFNRLASLVVISASQDIECAIAEGGSKAVVRESVELLNRFSTWHILDG